MTKRVRDWDGIVDEDALQVTKLRKLHAPQPVSAEYRNLVRLNLPSLPDELLLRILSFLAAEDLIRAQSTSRRISTLTKDSQLWKQLYFERFVYRRFGRMVRSVFTTERKSRDHRPSYKHNGRTQMDWKSKYRLSHKWSNGTCNRREIMLATKVLPRTFLCLRGNMAITADNECGLRAWKTRDEKQTLVACIPLSSSDDPNDLKPTALSVEVDQVNPDHLNIVIGFAAGQIKLYMFDLLDQEFQSRQTFQCFRDQAVSSLAQSNGGYFLAMADNQAMSLHRTTWNQDVLDSTAPQTISSLRSKSDWKPVSVNLRTSARTLLACIIYAYPRFLSGWSVGIQELRWDVTTHELLSTRIATSPHPESLPRNVAVSRSEYLPPTSTKPTSLCYTHPYLLATHPDNTLGLYMVRSTDTELSIGPGMRLWGHTSDVYAANIGDRGKAVTIAYGGDVRVWQLEEGLTSALARKATPGPLVSVRVQPTTDGQTTRETAAEDIDENFGDGSRPELDEGDRLPQVGELTPTSIDFDEERLVVLQNRGTRSQALFIYDFT